jgi:dipeptidyl aminopeptidase/acylaminoacyl peptidase
MSLSTAFKRLSLLLAFAAGVACSTLSVGQVVSPKSTTTPTAMTLAPTASPTPTLGNPSQAAWIAFINKNNLWLIHPDGSGLRRVTNNAQTAEDAFQQIRWSPDGQKLAFSQGGQIYAVDMATFAPTLLQDEAAGGFDWSLDGKQIMFDDPPVQAGKSAFSFQNKGLWVTNVENGDKKLLAKSSGDVQGLFNPDWSPDNSRVLLSFDSLDSTGYSVLDLASGKMVPVQAGSANPLCAWQPGSSNMACNTATTASASAAEVGLFDKNAHLLRQYRVPDDMAGYSQPLDLLWSPDGTQLAVSSHKTNPVSTSILSMDSGALQPLASDVVATDWSPDGQLLVVVSSESNSNLPREISLVDVHSGAAIPLADGYNARWQPSASVAAARSTPVSPAESPTRSPTQATATSTPCGLCAATPIPMTHTPKGNFLELSANGQQVQYGPLEAGVAAIGPNGNFFVYVSSSGTVYAARVGDKNLTKIGSVREFTAIHLKQAPAYELFFVSDGTYSVQVRESLFNQDKTILIPRSITAAK